MQALAELFVLLVQFFFQQGIDFMDVLLQCVQLRRKGGVLLDVLFDEHQDEADHQQQAGAPDGIAAKPLDADAACRPSEK